MLRQPNHGSARRGDTRQLIDHPFAVFVRVQDSQIGEVGKFFRQRLRSPPKLLGNAKSIVARGGIATKKQQHIPARQIRRIPLDEREQFDVYFTGKIRRDGAGTG